MRPQAEAAGQQQRTLDVALLSKAGLAHVAGGNVNHLRWRVGSRELEGLLKSSNQLQLRPGAAAGPADLKTAGQCSASHSALAKFACVHRAGCCVLLRPQAGGQR